jgi:hypothetical protein
LEELERSPLSDKRDTLLFTTFIRPTPNWTLAFDLRYGKNHFARPLLPAQPTYLEYEIELITRLFDHWHLGLTYEKRESDQRWAFYLKLDPGPP